MSKQGKYGKEIKFKNLASPPVKVVEIRIFPFCFGQVHSWTYSRGYIKHTNWAFQTGKQRKEKPKTIQVWSIGAMSMKSQFYHRRHIQGLFYFAFCWGMHRSWQGRIANVIAVT